MGDDDAVSRPPRSGIVNQACGMVAEQVRCATDEAIVLMQARAVETDQSLEQIAMSVVLRKLRFDTT
jgi:AmiR/NasT family two-component response regulator